MKPTLVSVSSGLAVSFSPARLVLYDSAQTVTGAVLVNAVTPDSPLTTLVVQNVIASCDSVFAVPGGSVDNTTYAFVEFPEEEEDLSLELAIGLSVSFALVIGLDIFLLLRTQAQGGLLRVESKGGTSVQRFTQKYWSRYVWVSFDGWVSRNTSDNQTC
jgi:hypothetical protein